MLVSEFVNTMAFGMVKGICQIGQMGNTYKRSYFRLPRIYCKDGFNISVQVNSGCYCASENGVRTFGTDWKLVEWGCPSEPIDGEKYSSDGENTMESVGGYVEIGLIEELCEAHGGIDLQLTLKNGLEI